MDMLRCIDPERLGFQCSFQLTELVFDASQAMVLVNYFLVIHFKLGCHNLVADCKMKKQ